jgi:hypothetical protein
LINVRGTKQRAEHNKACNERQETGSDSIAHVAFGQVVYSNNHFRDAAEQQNSRRKAQRFVFFQVPSAERKLQLPLADRERKDEVNEQRDQNKNVNPMRMPTELSGEEVRFGAAPASDAAWPGELRRGWR